MNAERAMADIERPAQRMGGVRLRRVPAPYRAILAICSDLDETRDARAYGETMRFLNTTQSTSMGPGVGLEVGNTIYFDMPPNQFAYWNTDDAGRAMARALMKSGHIDCLHSYGDLATTRGHAERALEELERAGCRLDVWIDHAVAPTNFGADIMRGRGDVVGDPAYHADITLAHGVQFVWRGRVTSVVAQDTPPRLTGGLDPRATPKTLLKEAAKQALARVGSNKYAPHARNQVLWPARLRDGAPVLEFLRTNWHPEGVSVGDTGDGLGEVLTDGALDELVRRGGVSVLYTHLGKTRARGFSAATCEGLRRLAARAHGGEILVTTTRRLLGYIRAREDMRWVAERAGGTLTISVDSAGLGPAEAQGLTFESDEAPIGRIEVDGAEMAAVSGGAPRLGAPWRRLEFPCW